MKPNPSSARLIENYNLGFVLLLAIAFLFVTAMSSASQATSKFEDRFYKRNLLIENFNRLRLKVGDRVFNHVLIGQNGWMEYTGDFNLDDYQNALSFRRKTLRRISRNIQNCYQYAQEQNITFLIVVAPNKATIYPEKLPEQIQPLSDRSRLDELNAYLKKYHIPGVLDLRPALLEARQQQDVYYQMGTHWNELGAYAAYKTILSTLSQSHPELVPYPEKFFRFRNDPQLGAKRGDKEIARLIQANYLSLEPNLFYTRNMDEFVSQIYFPGTTLGYHSISWIPDRDLPSLMIFHDSFGVAGLNRFLSLNFSKVSYIFDQGSSKYLNKPIIEMFSPDVLIYEVVERNLSELETDLAGCAAK